MGGKSSVCMSEEDMGEREQERERQGEGDYRWLCKRVGVNGS